MGDYLRRVAAAAARKGPPGMSTIGMPSRLPEILYSPAGLATPQSLSDVGPLPLELEKESTPGLILPERAVPGNDPLRTEPSTAETAGAPYTSPESDNAPLVRVPALEPELTMPHDPRKIPPLTEPAGTPEQGHPAVDHATKGSSTHPDRPLPPASPQKPVVSPPGSVQTAAEIRSKDSEAIGGPDASRGIASKGINFAATAEPVDRPRHHPGRSETREAIGPPRPGPAQPFRIQARQSNPSRVDASILRKSAGKDAGVPKPIAPSPAVPVTAELSPSGGNQARPSIQHAEEDALHPMPVPPDWQGQEKPGAPQLTTPSVPAATPPRSGRGGQAITPPSVADRLNSQKIGTRIAIGRIEVEVNNHPPPVSAGRSTAQPASGEINLESRFLGRFVLRPT